MQRRDSCSTVDGPSRVGCESALLMANLLVFSAVHQRLVGHGGQQESLGYCSGISHEEICALGARDSRTILLQKERSPCGAPGRTREQMLENPCLLPRSIFSHFTTISLTIDNFLLS